MNPLLRPFDFPRFDLIKPDHVEPAIREILADNRAELTSLKLANDVQALLEVLPRLDRLSARLAEAWAPVAHLNAVMNSEDLRLAYNACLPLLSEYETELNQDVELYALYQRLESQQTELGLTLEQQKAVSNALRDFRLSGVALSGDERKQYGDLKRRLNENTSLFSEHILDATDAWHLLISETDRLAGLPENARALAAQAAVQQGQKGFRFDLSAPSYVAVMTYAEDRELRECVYEAFVTRASELGPQAEQFDNSALMVEIMRDRVALANLVGFQRYTELSLATKMAESPEAVMAFLVELADRSKPIAQADYAEVKNFGEAKLGLTKLEPWDIAYCAEQLKQAQFDLSEDEVSNYFPVSKVIDGLFDIVKQLFGIDVEPVTDMTVWHGDVLTYRILRAGKPLARFYFDLYARPKKRGGAWMAECVNRRRDPESGDILPVAFLTCNFSPPLGGRPALLRHSEVVTLFHEFGHGLHHMLTQVDCGAVSGINGVAWDAVELPSQFLENWCWDREALQILSAHIETGEPMPDEMLQKLLAARNFQSGMQMVRQLEFGLFDFKLHDQFDGRPDSIQNVIDEVREAVAVTPTAPFNRFQHGFSHIFGDVDGYAAGYYSYKWAEVLSADAFSKFQEEGVFNRQTGERFLNTVLEQGGSKDALTLFEAFRGRLPKIDALLLQLGITT